jgi:hypothetical protein
VGADRAQEAESATRGVALQPDAPTARLPGVVEGLGSAASVLALQRSAGNAAVVRLLAGGGRDVRRTGAPRLSRYEAGEHAQFGSDEKVMVNGVPISKGNIIAMGDFFRSPEDMQKADPQVLKNLDAAITRDRQARTTGKDEAGNPVKAPTNADLQKITKPLGSGNAYMDLNKENEAHFAPPKGGADPSGKDHKSRWESLHRQALDEAHQIALTTSVDGKAPAPSATPKPPAPPEVSVQPPLKGPGPDDPKPAAAPKLATEKAVTTNMFAAHFLTDAFAAGHLINKGEVMEQAKAAWKKLPTDGVLLQENSFTKEVARRVLADPQVTGKMADMEMLDVRATAAGSLVPGGVPLYATPGLNYGPVTPERLSELLHLTSRFQADTFFNIFARMVHDRLNRDGVMVENDAGSSWKLSGDETLNTDSLRIGRDAVAESEKNLEDAARTPGDLPYQDMFTRVWKYTPHPTAEGQKFIDQVREELTNAANPAAVDAAVALSVHEIETAIDEMIEMGILRRKKGAATPETAASAPDAGPAPALVPAGPPPPP